MRPAVLITGGAKRVGAALSRYFARKGYDIALHHNGTPADAVKAEIEALGAACHVFRYDLGDIAGLPGLMEKVLDKLPACNALINSASVFERADFMETDEALYDRQMAINLKAPFFLSQAFARRVGKGAIVNILDTDIVTHNTSHFAYLLSKKALGEMTVMAARSLGPGIRVNAVCPGCIMPSGENDEAYEKKMAAMIPARSHPDADEVAEAALWLLGQPHVTGQLIFVDGGKHAI